LLPPVSPLMGLQYAVRPHLFHRARHEAEAELRVLAGQERTTGILDSPRSAGLAPRLSSLEEEPQDGTLRLAPLEN